MIFKYFSKFPIFFFRSAGAWERSRRIGTVRFRRLLVMLFHHLLVAESFEFDPFSSFYFLFFQKPARARAPNDSLARCYGDRPFHEIGRPFTFPRSSQSTKIDKKKNIFSLQILSI